MCIDPVIPFHYLGITSLSGPAYALETSAFVQNAFYLDVTSVPAGYYSYWFGKGVDGTNNAHGWELTMWSIIHGTAPMFYIKYDGNRLYTHRWDANTRVSGGTVIAPLRVTGDYPQGLYKFNGTVKAYPLVVFLRQSMLKYSSIQVRLLTQLH